MKKSLAISKQIDKNIKVGSFVYVWDGSSITSESLNGKKEVYIINSYPEIGINEKLENVIFKVIETDVSDKVTYPSALFDFVYLQDILIESPNGEKFRTSSKFVRLADD